MFDAALWHRVPIDISAGPAFWGAVMGGQDSEVLMQVSSVHHERATDAGHAADLVQAHLIETLSCLGRSHVDFYFLRSRIALEEAQIAGALEAMEAARQEGHIGFFGLYAEGHEVASLANWQFHDAFEVVSIEPPSTSLQAMASQRRVGVLTRASTPGATNGPVLISVSSPPELEAALGELVGGVA